MRVKPEEVSCDGVGVGVWSLEWDVRKAGTWGTLMTSALAPDVGLRPEGMYTEVHSKLQSILLVQSIICMHGYAY
jgi:hypothetical protein